MATTAWFELSAKAENGSGILDQYYSRKKPFGMNVEIDEESDFSNSSIDLEILS